MTKNSRMMVFYIAGLDNKNTEFEATITAKRQGDCIKFYTQEPNKQARWGPILDIAGIEECQLETFFRRTWLNAIHDKGGIVRSFKRIK